MAPFLIDPGAFEGLLRVIEYLLPVGGPFPSVRSLVTRVDASVSVGAIPVRDRNALLFILRVFRWMPRWFLGLPMNLVQLGTKLPGGVGAPFRMLALGLEGLSYTLYFSTPGALSVLRWDAQIRSLGESKS